MNNQTTINKKCLLVIEDDKFYCNIFQKKFTEVGFEILIAHDGNEGIAIANKKRPDIVLLDLIMPNKDGFATLEELKEIPTMKNVPIIILSNLSQENDVEKAKKLGATEYIVKANVSLQEIVDKVKGYLQ